MDRLRYPIGQFVPLQAPSAEQRNRFIEEVSAIPGELSKLVQHLTPDQLQTPYREGGWSIQQVIHHLADNDAYAYLRFKKGLAEENPAVGSYQEDRWAQLKDYEEDIALPLALLDAVHRRFAAALQCMKPTDFSRTYSSPSFGLITLDVALQQCLWHDKHHIAQISSLIMRKKWK